MRRDKWQTKHLEKPRDIPGQCNHLYIPQSSKIVPFSWSDCLKRHSLICSALIFLMPGNLGDKRVMKILGWVRSPSPQHMSWRTLAVTWCLQVAKFFFFFFLSLEKEKHITSPCHQAVSWVKKYRQVRWYRAQHTARTQWMLAIISKKENG